VTFHHDDLQIIATKKIEKAKMHTNHPGRAGGFEPPASMDLTAWHKKRTDPSEWLVASGGGFWSEKSTSKKPWKKKTSFQRVLCNGAEMHRET